MLLQFKVNNFRSIKDTAVFSMNTAANKAHSHSFAFRNYHFLKSAAIYGANASGKSNVLRAMAFMQKMVLNHSKITQSTDKLPHEPFRLNTETENASSSFEMIFFSGDCKYRYGFEADDKIVYAEWLFADEKGREARLFERETENNKLYINKSKFKEANGLKVPNNQLLIWKCDQQDGEISKAILEWFQKIIFINNLDSAHFSFAAIEDKEFMADVLQLLKTADLSIDGLNTEDREFVIGELSGNPSFKIAPKQDGGIKLIRLQTSHKKFDETNQFVGSEQFVLNEDESQGTQKFFALLIPILDALKQGKVLIIDEFDASLHSLLGMALIKLFHHSEINKYNTQLIFTTHDTNLLSNPELFERDQIWFTEKDQYGSTNLYSLLEFRKKNTGKDVRRSDNLEKHYLQGRYGAIPNLGEF
ncbi:MAG: AAA family ATPase [Methylococcaceae bacterium]|nr:AAA family ATPase [Methylococcaceae bacterium]